MREEYDFDGARKNPYVRGGEKKSMSLGDLKKATVQELEQRLHENQELYILSTSMEDRRLLFREDHAIF